MGSNNSQIDNSWEASREKFRLIISATAFVGSTRIRDKFTEEEIREFLRSKSLTDSMIDEAYSRFSCKQREEHLRSSL